MEHEHFDSMSRPDAPSRDETRHGVPQGDNEKYSLTVSQASLLFANAGVPRSERTVQRFCKRSDLDCQMVDLEYTRSYMITKSSIERRIVELQQIQSFKQTTHRDTPRPDASRRDETRHDVPRQQADDSEKDKEIQKLRNDVFDLKVTNQVKDHLLKEKETVEQENQKLSRWVGRLEGRVLQLGGTNDELLQIEGDTVRHEATPIDTVDQLDHPGENPTSAN